MGSGNNNGNNNNGGSHGNNVGNNNRGGSSGNNVGNGNNGVVFRTGWFHCKFFSRLIFYFDSRIKYVYSIDKSLMHHCFILHVHVHV